MNRAIAWFTSNPVAANLLMAAMVVGGLMAVLTLPQQTFPDIEIEVIQVSVEYLGAAPEEVEEGVCVRIEEEIDGIEGIDQITSTSVEGACVVLAEVLLGEDVNRVLDDIKNRVDSIDTFPDEAEKPVVAQFAIRHPVADVVLSGPVDEAGLKVLGERLRDEILALPDITQAELRLVRPVEISIEVPEESLRRHGLTFDEVVRAVQRSSLDLPGGSVKTAGGEILLRSKGQSYRGEEFEGLVVLARPDGTRVTLGEIARVVDGFDDSDLSASFDQEPVAVVQVFRVGDQDVLEISRLLYEYVAKAADRLPADVDLTIWQDDSEMLRGRLDTLRRNARSGFVLVLIVLALFLRGRVALWVSLGVPVAFLGALWVFSPLDLTINAITLFALIVVLGILVDDAIVVGESIYAEQQKGGPRRPAAVRGAQHVAVPVVFGVLTTVAAFSPMLTVPGPMGQVFATLSTAVIACLLFSLVESQFVLPAHLSHGHEHEAHQPHTALGRRWRAVQDFFGTSLERLAKGGYSRLLRYALTWRYAAVAAALALLMLIFGVVRSGRVSFSFFPPVQADYIAAWLTMPQGTPFEATQAAIARIEASVEDLRAEIDPGAAPEGSSMVEHVLAVAGSQPFRDRQSDSPAGFGGKPAGGAHVGEVVIELIPSEQRAIDSEDVTKVWRRIVGEIPGAEELVFASDLFSAGTAIDIELRGPSVPDLRRAADRVKEELATYPGVIDISDTFREGKREVKLRIRPEAEPLGLTQRDLARQVRQAFYGEEAQRIQRGRDDVRVMVRYPEGRRRSLADLENLRVRTPDGAEVPFSTVAEAEIGRGYASIRRSDRNRVVSVTANIDRAITTANEVLDDLQAGALPAILADVRSVSYSLEGEQREQRRAFGGLASAYVLALLAIYALLAIPLHSYSQPLIIMSVIPFGLVGSIGGHLLLGFDLSFMSIVGIVAMSGVVVNASLVLVHSINVWRQAGLPLREAVAKAAVTRFRPIVLTSLTTFVGLTPLMQEESVQAQFLIPMAISLAYGVLFATVISLFVVPCGYRILDDLHNLWNRRSREPRPAPPATVLPRTRSAS